MNTIPTKTRITVVIPCFGSVGTKAFLNFLAHCDKPLSEKRNGDKLTLVYESNSMTKQFRQSLEKVFNEDYIKWEATEVPEYATKTEWLLDLIRNFDWTYQMSDDHRYNYNRPTLGLLNAKRMIEDVTNWNQIANTSSQEEELVKQFKKVILSAKGGGKFNRTPKEFSITIEYIWKLFVEQNRKCAISGLPLSFGGTSKECKLSDITTRTASLDRIDSSKGYVEGNVHWIHKDINIMKNDTELSKFLNYCKIITENNS